MVGKNRPPNKGQPPRRGPHAPKPQPYPKGAGGKGTKHGGKGKGAGGGQTRPPRKPCDGSNLIIAVVLTLVYGVPRLLIDSYREKRSVRRGER